MASSSGPNLGFSYGWTQGENNWHTGIDANLKRLDALLGLSVKSRATTTPPGSPANGDRFIIPAGASGAWAGKTNQLAVRVAGAWEYHSPQVGWQAYVEDEDKLSLYKSTGWSAGITP